MSRPRKVLFLILLILLSAVSLGLYTNRLQWRARLIVWKMQGSLPMVSWSEVWRRLTPFSGGQTWQIGDLDCVFAMKGAIRAAGSGPEPCPVLWDTPVGGFWGRTTDGTVLACLMKEQLIEKLYDHHSATLRSGDVVLDVGAHLGTFTRYALRHEAKLVVAFEPEPTNITCFQKSFQKEISEGRVILVETALWDSAGPLIIKKPAEPINSGGFSVLPERRTAVAATIAATTMDETVRRLKLDRVDFIKMDIEGAERNALRGGRETLSRFGPRMALCIYHRPDDPVVLPQVVREAKPGYRVEATLTQAYFY